MRFLLLNTDYQAFLDQMYRRQRGLSSASYVEQMTARNATFFGVGDAYARALRLRGHEAHDIHMNNAFMQAAWAREDGPRRLRRRFPSTHVRIRRGVMPWVGRQPDGQWLLDVLAAQMDHYRPDVVLNHDISWVAPATLRELVGRSMLLVGQHAAPPYPAEDYTFYDLIVSSWPPVIERMRAAGVRTEHLGLGFEPAVLDHLGHLDRDLPVTFIGSISDIHSDRTALVEAVCAAHPETKVFSPSINALPKLSPIRRSYAGQAFGLDMFRVLARSQITINHHGFPQPHANNMRLFEATGMGAALVTDAKSDLDRYFRPGLEVITYKDVDQCLTTIRDLRSGDRDQLARRGQRRTLQDHTWDRRIKHLLTVL